MARIDSQGLYLQAGDGTSPESFTTIGEVADMPAINAARSMRDRTGYDDTVRQLYPGTLEDLPSFTVTIFWDPDDTAQNGLYTAYGAKTADNYKVLCPDSPATEWTFTARVVGFSTPYGPVDDDLRWDIVFQPTTTITKV